jgi:site-specific DNA recombinase
MLHQRGLFEGASHVNAVVVAHVVQTSPGERAEYESPDVLILQPRLDDAKFALPEQPTDSVHCCPVVVDERADELDERVERLLDMHNILCAEVQQTMLATNRNGHQSGASFDQPSLLAGLLWDEHGRRMSPTHSQKGPSRRYRYYVSRNDGPAKDQPIMRVPAADIEAVVVGRLCALLRDEGALMDAVATDDLDAVALNGMLFECRRQADQLNTATPMDVRKIIARYISRIQLHSDRVIVHVCLGSLIEEAGPAAGAAGPRGEKITLMVVARLGRIGKEVRLVIDPSTSAPMSAVRDGRDPALIKLIVKAHAARAALMATPHECVDDIAKAQGYDRDYFGVLLRLSWLAPGITQTILEGQQSVGLNRQVLARMAGIPLCWKQQQALDFALQGRL